MVPNQGFLQTYLSALAFIRAYFIYTYTILQPSTDFDSLDENCMYYDIEFRIVRIRLDNGTYICIATNLSEELPLEEINKLYRMRWSEETSFRELKYTIGLINWHSSKYDGILQEINAHMILYNFCELVTSHAMVKKSKNTKHVYKINFATIILRYEADMQSVFLSYTKK